MLVEPDAHADVAHLRELKGRAVPPDAAIWVGPEGGWDPREWTVARGRGVSLMSLGHRTLRADAVAIAALSVLSFLWEP